MPAEIVRLTSDDLPVDQRVSGLPVLAQQFVFHDQLTNAPGRLAKLCLQRIVLVLLEASIDTGQGTLAPFFEPADNMY